MRDARIDDAQRLFWEVQALRTLGAPQKLIATKLNRMAQLHEDRARELLAQRHADGWIDLFAAITAWGQAGSEQRACALLGDGRQLAPSFEGQEGLLSELRQLEEWLDTCDIVPALEDFARALPPYPRAAA